MQATLVGAEGVSCHLAVLVGAVGLLLLLVRRGILVLRAVVGVRVVAPRDASVVDVPNVLAPPVCAQGQVRAR